MLRFVYEWFSWKERRTKLDDAMLKLEKAEKVSCEILDVDVLAEVYTQIFDGRASWLSTCTSLLVSQTHSLHHLRRRRRLSLISFLYFCVYLYTSSHSFATASSVWVLSGFCHDLTEQEEEEILYLKKWEISPEHRRERESWALNAKSNERSIFVFLTFQRSVIGSRKVIPVNTIRMKGHTQSMSDRMSSTKGSEISEWEVHIVSIKCRTEFQIINGSETRQTARQQQ